MSAFVPRIWSGTSVGQVWTLEIFAGSAVLCSVAKQQGMTNSIAVDKVQKRGARSSITRLDLTREVDRTVLDSWLDSNLLFWVHLAPVCGTASRAVKFEFIQQILSL